MSTDTTVEDSPPVTGHAAVQWVARASSPSVSPGTAWLHATRIQPRGWFQPVDEVRYHAPTGTLLLYADLQITTVYDIDDLREEVYHAVKHALPEDGHE